MINAGAFLGDAQARTQALAEYGEAGCLIVEDVFSSEQVARMRET